MSSWVVGVHKGRRDGAESPRRLAGEFDRSWMPLRSECMCTATEGQPEVARGGGVNSWSETEELARFDYGCGGKPKWLIGVRGTPGDLSAPRCRIGY
jgi:hypothetical protein